MQAKHIIWNPYLACTLYPVIISAHKVAINFSLNSHKNITGQYIVHIFTDHLLISFSYYPQLYLHLFYLSSITQCLCMY